MASDKKECGCTPTPSLPRRSSVLFEGVGNDPLTPTATGLTLPFAQNGVFRLPKHMVDETPAHEPTPRASSGNALGTGLNAVFAEAARSPGDVSGRQRSHSYVGLDHDSLRTLLRNVDVSGALLPASDTGVGIPQMVGAPFFRSVLATSNGFPDSLLEDLIQGQSVGVGATGMGSGGSAGGAPSIEIRGKKGKTAIGIIPLVKIPQLPKPGGPFGPPNTKLTGVGITIYVDDPAVLAVLLRIAFWPFSLLWLLFGDHSDNPKAGAYYRKRKYDCKDHCDSVSDDLRARASAAYSGAISNCGADQACAARANERYNATMDAIDEWQLNCKVACWKYWDAKYDEAFPSQAGE